MLSDQTISVFSWSVFPLGLTMFALLIGSKFCCECCARGVIKLVDAILFCTCGSFQHSEFSFFWAIFIACLLVAWFSMVSYFEVDERVHNGQECWTEQCWHKRSNQLKRKFKAERNFWIAAFALTLFVAVHRLRHHIKHHLKLLQLLDESLEKITKEGPATVADWLRAELGREIRACPWRSCTRSEHEPPPSLEADAEAQPFLEPDAQGPQSPVLASAVVVDHIERSDADIPAASSATDTKDATDGSYS